MAQKFEIRNHIYLSSNAINETRNKIRVRSLPASHPWLRHDISSSHVKTLDELINLVLLSTKNYCNSDHGTRGESYIYIYIYIYLSDIVSQARHLYWLSWRKSMSNALVFKMTWLCCIEASDSLIQSLHGGAQTSYPYIISINQRDARDVRSWIDGFQGYWCHRIRDDN